MTAQLERDPGNDARPSGTSIAVRRLMPAAILLALATAVGLSLSPPRAAEVARSIPAPAVDETVASGAAAEVAVLAGGCFWGVEEILRAVPGVLDTDVGYTGGWLENPTYHDTHDSKSGHAESIRVTFDPSVLSYETLLEQWFFKLHDPTTLNRQGNDIGTQYRSAIFPQSPEQKEIAERVIARVTASGQWKRPITTTIEPAGTWYSAEGYHQDYLKKNPGGYTCHFMRN
jgi:methionine-S-sulfoxide reductase